MKQSLLFQQDISLLSRSGLCDEGRYAITYTKVLEAWRSLEKRVFDGHFSFLRHAFDTMEQKKEIQELCQNIQSVKMILVMGRPQETQSIKAIMGILQSWVWIDGVRPRICLLDTLDPEVFWEIMSIADPKTTAIIAFSLQGECELTLLQLMRALEYWRGQVDPEILSRHIFCISPGKKNSLRSIGEKFSFVNMLYPSVMAPGYGCFSLPFLLPLIFAGLDWEKFLTGAMNICIEFFKGKLPNIVQGVTLFHLAQEQGIYHHCFQGSGPIFRALIGWMIQIRRYFERGYPFSLYTSFADLDDETQSQNTRQNLCFFTKFFEHHMAREQIDPDFWQDVPLVYELARMPMLSWIAQCHQVSCQKLITQKNFLRVMHIKSLNEETVGALMMNHILETLLYQEIIYLSLERRKK